MEIELKDLSSSPSSSSATRAVRITIGDDLDYAAKRGSDSALLDKIGKYLSKAQQARLTRLFQACDTNKHGYLSAAELESLFSKLNALIPNTEFAHVIEELGQHHGKISCDRFLYAFALAKEAKKCKEKEIEEINHKLGISEVIGAYLLKSFAQKRSAAHVRHADVYQKAPEQDNSRMIVLMSERDSHNLFVAKILCILEAFFIGALCAGVASGLQYYAGYVWGYQGDLFGAGLTAYSYVSILNFWGVLIGATIFTTIIEIMLLYWSALRYSAWICDLCGLPAWLVGYVSDVEHAAASLVRAALELSHPHSPILGIRPTRYANKIIILVRALIWKLKRTVTFQLLSLLVTKIVTRAVAKAVAPFLSVPVAAFWDALVAWKILHNVHAIAIGSTLMGQLMSKFIEPRWDSLSPTARHLVYCCAGTTIAFEQSVHPNLEILLRLVVHRYGPPDPNMPLDDRNFVYEKVMEIPHEEQIFILQLLAVCNVCNGNPRYGSLQFLAHLCRNCVLNTDEQGISDLYTKLYKWPEFRLDVITELFTHSLDIDRARTFRTKLRIMLKVIVLTIAF